VCYPVNQLRSIYRYIEIHEIVGVGDETGEEREAGEGPFC